LQRFWWVNHSQTSAEELDGSYIWAPKREANGARSQFYDNLARVTPGDLILSYANGAIAGKGEATDFAVALSKPAEFGRRGSTWGQDGWLVPISWARIVGGPKPKAFLSELAPLLPEKYSPLQRETGNGNQKAYLCEISAELYDLILTKIESSSSILDSPSAPHAANFIERLEDSLSNEIANNPSLTSTERIQLTQARVGQGLFRQRIIDKEKRCRCTGVDDPSFLIASHIKPWRACKTATERLDASNGLLLTPNADLLFDRGFMTFDDYGLPIFSARIYPTIVTALVPKMPEAHGFSKEQITYLQYHRSHIFLP
jgi:putative restriction endonuclease